jgi:hypothetical protein
MHRVVLVAMLLIGCVDQPAASEPTEADIQQLDDWAEASGGKADLPSTMSGLVAWVEDLYRNRLSAVWGNQEHPATSAAAIQRVRTLMAHAGIADPSAVLFKTTVQRLRFSKLADHSEINIVLPSKQVVRLIGDPKGPGVFLDAKKFQEALSPALCLTWAEVQTAIAAAYEEGAYGGDFVCHNVTERVLRSLAIGSAKFSAQIHAYSIARWVWGPVTPSFHSQDPSAWPESRTCPN